MKWYIYDESGELEAPVRIKYHMTKPELASIIAEKTTEDGKQQVLDDDDNFKKETWTKKKVEDNIRDELRMSGDFAPRSFDPDSPSRERKYQQAQNVVDRYYDNYNTFQIEFPLTSREVALFISDEINQKEKLTKEYVDGKVRSELKDGGIHQAWYTIGDKVSEEDVKKAERKITELYGLDEFRKKFDFEPKFKSKGRGKGWHNDPCEHALASMGYKPRRSN